MVLASNIDVTTTILAGVDWLVSESGMGRAEARARAKSSSAQAFVVRGGDKNLGTAQLKGKLSDWRDKHVVSFAGTLADLGPAEAWCGVFQFEGKFAFVSIGDGGVVFPDGDKIFDSEREARLRLDDDRALVGLCFAPGSWAVPEAQDSDELLGSVDWGSAAPMHFVGGGSSKRPTVAIIGGIGLLVAALAGWQYYQTQQLKREAAELAKAPPPPPNPWVTKPKPYHAARACFELRGRLANLAHNGWAIEKIECSFESAKFSAVLNSFSVNSVLPAVDPGASLQMKSDGSGIEISGVLSLPSGADRSNEASDLRTALAARNLIVGSANAAGWQTNGNRSQFNFQIAANLEELSSKLGKLPTLSFNRMEYSGGQWRVDGEVFN